MSTGRTKSKRRFSAYGSLDKKTRHWTYLPPVRQTTSQLPDGDHLVYQLNASTLEVGQGMSGVRGMFWLMAAAGLAAFAFGVTVFLRVFSGSTQSAEMVAGLDAVDWVLFGLVALAVPIAVGFLLFLLIGDLFGYLDAPVRFDRVRRQVYVWSSRQQGPLVLEWDRIRPVAQSVGAPPYQVNQFRSVLLVDEDENGDVRFEDGMPRIAQIGAALLNREQTLAAYEYVRTFMERGPQAVPPVQTHLVMRPLGWRPFVDILGVCHGMMRRQASLPKPQRRPGWMVFGVVVMSVFAPVLWPLQLAQGVAVKFMARVPRWPEDYQSRAAQGGLMKPPPGAEPNDAALLPHERVITGIWVASALAVYAAIAWAIAT